MSVASYGAGDDASDLLNGATTAAARRVSTLPSRPQSVRRPSIVPSIRSSVAPSVHSASDDAASTVEEEDDEVEEASSSSSEEDEEDEDEEGDDDVPEKVTSTGTKAQIKWIKGAVIGAGSFGTVSLGMDAKLGTLMAVKQVELPTGNSANEERKKSMLHALEREIDILKTLTHPHIVTYLDSSTDGNHLNIFLEYVPGGSVSGLLSNYGAFEEVLVCKWIGHVLLGVEYLHERDIIHRDLKGANILVDNKGCVKISDFGISRKVNNDLLAGNTAKNHRVSLQGSVFWMAPEVVKQTPYTYKADIWSIGCVTLEMLTGSHPFPKLNQMQAIWKIGSFTAPDLPSDISPAAEHFLRLTFAKTAADRPSAHELLQSDFVQSAQLDMPVGSNADLAVTPRTAVFPSTAR